ncbi:MAG: hypothetical protein K0S32_2343 [Bacteroidetes bacterium]|jgi:hypothetical protein|nr:hypothetical protein [Bacteroidota bacterium]
MLHWIEMNESQLGNATYVTNFQGVCYEICVVKQNINNDEKYFKEQNAKRLGNSTGFETRARPDCNILRF